VITRASGYSGSLNLVVRSCTPRIGTHAFGIHASRRSPRRLPDYPAPWVIVAGLALRMPARSTAILRARLPPVFGEWRPEAGAVTEWVQEASFPGTVYSEADSTVK